MRPEKKPFDNLKEIDSVIAIAAGKGGVGKSCVTVNLALALKQKGFKVGILDADIYGPSVCQMLQIESPPAQNTDSPERIIPAEALGLKVISMAFFQERAAVVRAPIANGIITQFLHQVDWGGLDYLLIDCPPGTGDIQLTLLQQGSLTGALVVTTPQEVALIDVVKSVQMFIDMQIPLIGVVENMSYFQDPVTGTKHYPFGKDGGDRLARQCGLPLLGRIPIDAEICQCADEGCSLFEKVSLSEGAKAFLELVELFQHHLSALKETQGAYLKNFELIWQEMSNG
jgi:ATP-binding protein involved in chromosome partitioning